MNQQFGKRVEILRKDILTLEYDLPHILNDDMRSHKQFMLRLYKKELEELLKRNPIQNELRR